MGEPPLTELTLESAIRNYLSSPRQGFSPPIPSASSLKKASTLEEFSSQGKSSTLEISQYPSLAECQEQAQIVSLYLTKKCVPEPKCRPLCQRSEWLPHWATALGFLSRSTRYQDIPGTIEYLLSLDSIAQYYWSIMKHSWYERDSQTLLGYLRDLVITLQRNAVAKSWATLGSPPLPYPSTLKRLPSALPNRLFKRFEKYHNPDYLFWIIRLTKETELHLELAWAVAYSKTSDPEENILFRCYEYYKIQKPLNEADQALFLTLEQNVTPLLERRAQLLRYVQMTIQAFSDEIPRLNTFQPLPESDTSTLYNLLSQVQTLILEKLDTLTQRVAACAETHYQLAKALSALDIAEYNAMRKEANFEEAFRATGALLAERVTQLQPFQKKYDDLAAQLTSPEHENQERPSLTLLGPQG